MGRTGTTTATVALVASVALVACGDGGADTQSQSQEVTMWIYPVIADEAEHTAFWEEKVKQFQADHPDISVTVEVNPWAKRDEALGTAIAAGTEPDVVYLIPDQLPQYANAIEPIESYLGDDRIAAYRPNAVDSVSMDGHMMGAPMLMSVNPLVCNKAAFDAVDATGYPETWDDLYELAPVMREAGYDVTNYWGATDATLNTSFYPLLWQAGGDVFTEDGSGVAFNSAEGIRALSFIADLAESGYVESALLTTIPAFEQTNTAKGTIACTWQQVPADVETFWGAENVVVLPPLRDQESVAFGTVGSLSMIAGSDAKEAAGEWISFVTSPQASTEYVQAARYFSPYEGDELYADDPTYAAMEELLPTATVGPLHEQARQVMGVLAPEIQAALVGQKTPEQALADAESAAQHLLRR
ncbi:ABC transporter substrate-binding protein [Phytoactinopolyspora halotolerans]|uniref:Sugar ABC transporter substrate-binding protein n=1 Tax=Phytoactinopolyspora halotolerans TaxID=1981512 RepID=A0A6L9SA81_9ACTN|nr:sugar ABC transporter substrate-binding protein [Phytoactinopolyspora halotolerans]NEE01398.1 sugar ABC transporter substrate-binding protein [Phytoactinopolyspora halotolerans]